MITLTLFLALLSFQGQTILNDPGMAAGLESKRQLDILINAYQSLLTANTALQQQNAALQAQINANPDKKEFFRNVLYSALPPATYTGLTASVSDSNSIVWGATESGGGTPGTYAQVTSNGTNWTVTGK